MPDASKNSPEINLGRAIATYLSELTPNDRDSASAELHRMMRWFGPERNLSSVTPIELERYQQQLADSGMAPTARLQPLKDFFAHAKKKKLLAINLGAHVRVRRAAQLKRTPSERRATGADVIEMTQEGHDQLTKELERLEQVEAPKVRGDLQSAYADKDFRENAPYDAAKQRLGEIQGKINELKATLAAAMIVEGKGRSDRVALHSTVTIRDLTEDEAVTYTLVGLGEVDARRGRISVSSPVGKALLDRTLGETVVVQTPAGAVSYRIETISA